MMIDILFISYKILVNSSILKLSNKENKWLVSFEKYLMKISYYDHTED